MLKVATQNHDQKTRINLTRTMHKENAREIMLELTDTSNSPVEACSISSPTPDILASTINRTK